MNDYISNSDIDNPQLKPKQEPEGIGIFELIWLAIKDVPNILRSLKFAVVLIAVIIVFTLFGTVLPQERFMESPEQFAAEYAKIFKLIPNDGQTTFSEIFYEKVVVPLELYRVFDTALYFTLLCTLAVSSAICAYDRIFLTRRIYNNRQAKVSPEVISKLKYSDKGSLLTGVKDSAEKVTDHLKKLKYEIFTEENSEGAIFIFARKNTFRFIASLIFHFAILGIIIGGLIGNERVAGFEGRIALEEGTSDVMGYDQHAIEVAKNKNETMPQRTGGLLKLVNYYNIYREKEFGEIDKETGLPKGYVGNPSDFVSQIQVIEKNSDGTDEVVIDREIEVNYPLRYRGINYYQLSVTSRFDFVVITPEGQHNHVSAFMNQPFKMPIPIPEFQQTEFTIKNWDFAGGVWEAKDGKRTDLPFVVRVVDYGMSEMGGPLRLLGYFTLDTQQELDGYVIRLEKISEYSIFQYVRDPGIALVTWSTAILLTGIFISMYFPFRTARIMLKEEGKRTTYLSGGNWSDIPKQLREGLGISDDSEVKPSG